MESIRRRSLAASLGMLLVSCVSVPSGPYWQDQKWNESLFNAVQGSLHSPVGAKEQRTEHIKGSVSFTYLGDHLEDVSIVSSTGSPALDAALLQQVSTAEIPPALGPEAATPHRFELELRMPTPIPEFFDRFRVAAAKNVFYPRAAVLAGITGAVVVGLDYQGGVVSNAVILQSSGHKELDDAALHDVNYVKVAPPVEHPTDLLRVKMQICYSLGRLGSGACPGYQEVIQVINIP